MKPKQQDATGTCPVCGATFPVGIVCTSTTDSRATASVSIAEDGMVDAFAHLWMHEQEADQ